MPVRDGRAKKPVGQPRSPQGNQRKRGKTVEDEIRNAHDGQVKPNRGGSYQTDSNTGAPSQKRKDEGMETDCYAGGCTGATGDQVGTRRSDGNAETRLCNGARKGKWKATPG